MTRVIVRALIAPLLAAPVWLSIEARAATLRGRVLISSPLLDVAIDRTATGAGPTLTDSDAASSGTTAVGAGGGTAFYEASFGRLRGLASLDTSAPPTLPPSFDFDSGANGEAGFADVLTLSAPGMAGTQGSLRVLLDVRGSAGANAVGQDAPFVSMADANWLVNLGLGFQAGSFQQRTGGCRENQGGGVCSGYGDPFGVWTSEPITFTFGQATSLSLNLFATVFLRTVEGGSASGSTDLASSVDWLGFADVLDASGAPVATYAVTSESGTDWAVPVPEPASAWLVAVGLGALTRARASHRASRSCRRAA